MVQPDAGRARLSLGAFAELDGGMFRKRLRKKARIVGPGLFQRDVMPALMTGADRRYQGFGAS
ncbi:hypothetical protein ASAP_1016 [Asaia bogorensis]|uniref:Uncharacterized protein n=1 Tax=Asaia bogorensis TaxID=91915 RepID=A0A060QIJ4_9PROT|nr:hypothetical protein ASAP_1016 [Asaia bogorensis]